MHPTAIRQSEQRFSETAIAAKIAVADGETRRSDKKRFISKR